MKDAILLFFFKFKVHPLQNPKGGTLSVTKNEWTNRNPCVLNWIVRCSILWCIPLHGNFVEYCVVQSRIMESEKLPGVNLKDWTD